MRSHPDDIAFLDRQAWDPDGRPCGYGRHPTAPTIAYGEYWICRDDLAWRLHLDRCDATDAGRDRTPATTACGVCSDCGTETASGRVVAGIDQGSGPGYTVIICPGCDKRPGESAERGCSRT